MGEEEKRHRFCFYFIFHFQFVFRKKKKILKVREVLFFVSWKQFFSGKVFVIKLIPSKLSIRQFLIPFVILLLYINIYKIYKYMQSSKNKNVWYDVKTRLQQNNNNQMNQKQCFALFNFHINALLSPRFKASENRKINSYLPSF